MPVQVGGHGGRPRVAIVTAYVPPAFGTVKPSAANTGYAPYGGPALTVYPASGGPYGPITAGVLTITTPGATLDRPDIPARVAIQAANVTIRRGIVRGAAAVTSGSDLGLIDTSHPAAVNALVEDCVLRPDNPSAWMNTLRGDNITMQRCDISAVCDGLDLYSGNTGLQSNTRIWGNWIHGLAGYSPDSIARPFSHNDCIQITDGLGIEIRWNNLEGFLDPAIGDSTGVNATYYPSLNSNSAIQLTNGTGPISGLLVDGNWADGGGYTFNFAGTGGNLGSVTNNKFGRSSYIQGSGGTNGVPGSGGDNSVTFSSGGGCTFTSTAGNTYEDNGHPITVRVS